jgi:hypothetical protein
LLALLIVLGGALVALGALLLLRFPDRPGGEVRLLGLHVSSIGAGLPLVALGVLVSVVGATTAGGARQPPSTDSSDGGGSGGLVSGPPPDDAPACLAEFFRARPKVSVPRQRTLPVGADDVEVLAAEESKRQEFGLVLTSGDRVMGAAKLSYDDPTRRFRIGGIVAADCAPARWTASDVPGPNPSSAGQYSNLRTMLGSDTYMIELKPNSTIMEIELHRIRS